MDVTKVKALLAEAKQKQKQASALADVAQTLVKEAQKLCPHSVTEAEDSYCSGGYDYKASTTTVTSCGICGLRLGTETEQHDYYG